MRFTKVCRALFYALRSPQGVLPQARIADSSSRNSVRFSSARTTNRFPSSRLQSKSFALPDLGPTRSPNSIRLCSHC